MTELRFGIVGTGFIAGVVAGSIETSSKARLTAVSSRTQQSADAFVADRAGVAAVEGVAALLARDDVDAVYVATPTVTKEAIALAAIDAGKHVLVDKPLLDTRSAERMTQAAADRGLVFMDATHFVHHPRTQAIRAAIPERVGTPRSLHTAFYFPFSDRANIRFDPAQEPMGALGDMAWYSMRAVVEYLQPQGPLATVAAVAERDAETGAVMRVSGLVGFESGECSTLDIGYTAGTAIMDLSLLGTAGMIGLDDFVLDWTNSFAFQNPDIETGYVHRTGMATRKDFAFVETPSGLAQDVLMIDHFAELASSGDPAARAAYAEASLQTQCHLDALWTAVRAQ
ncbi:MAG: Gfo/Idh/MocA family oxidoreductase [Alphaproteobacteria bacterium]|nr:Gfo/Idh/MocA family oxidoreductase [Alphaproteobacteria bacterium]